MKTKDGVKSYSSDEEAAVRLKFHEHYMKNPIPETQVLENLGLFINSKTLSRILFMDHIYRKIVDVQGVVLDLGTRWGQNMSLFTSLRGIYEPFNRHRKIIGFDTFAGFPSISKEDGTSDLMKAGNVTVTEGYEEYLKELIRMQELDNPLAHIKKYEIFKGDAVTCLQQYLSCHPETIVSLCYFDFDLYEPTKKCLEMIRPRLVKGSVLGFDELNDPDSPGETTALDEVFGLVNIRLKRYRYSSRVSYFIME